METETPQPVYTVRYARVDSTSQEVGPFDTKDKAEQALFAVLSSPYSKDCSIQEWTSLQDYQDCQDTLARMRMERYRVEYESLKAKMEELEAAEPEPKKKRWW